MQDLQQDLKVNTQDKSSATKTELLAAIVAKQHKVMYNINKSIIELTRRLMNNEIVILNLRECIQDDLAQSVLYTFNAFGYTAEIDYEVMYRRGPPREDTDASPRLVVVRLHHIDVADKLIKLARAKNILEDNTTKHS